MGEMIVLKCDTCIEGRVPFVAEAHWENGPPEFLSKPRHHNGNGNYEYACHDYIAITTHEGVCGTRKEGDFFWRGAGHPGDLPWGDASFDWSIFIYRITHMENSRPGTTVYKLHRINGVLQ